MLPTMSDMVPFQQVAGTAIPMIAVVGPTASGKTALAVHLAKRFDGEVISADALAVYRGMDIGTAKPTKAEQQGIPHHCLDVLDPSEGCDAQRWLDLTENAIVDINARGKRVIVAGGTPLYLKLLLEGISAGPPKDVRLRSQLEHRYHNEGKNVLFAELQQVDPDYAADRHPNDMKRIVRALEVYQLTGKPYSSFHTTDGIRRSCWRTLLIGLHWNREQLHHRINARSRWMFQNGLVDEVGALRSKLSKQARDGVGYKEVIGYLKKAHDLKHACYLVQRNTRLLAKHQLTWYRRFQDIRWLDAEAVDLPRQAELLCKRFLEGVGENSTQVMLPPQ
jgi:tRNA dimethylallyltransferase